jgi:hypothetical protein
VARRGVRDQVEVALAQAQLGIGQAAVLVGQRAQRLREQGHPIGPDRELAGTGRDDRARRTHPVAPVELLDVGEGRGADELAGDEQLDLPGLVVQRREHGATVAADQHEPSGDRDTRARDAVGSELAGLGAHLRDGVVASEADRVRLDIAGTQPLELLEPVRALGSDEVLAVARVHRLAHGRRTLCAKRNTFEGSYCFLTDCSRT